MSETLAPQVEGFKGGETSPHSATEAPDSLHSTAYARILDLICEGPIKGFRHGSTNPLQDVYLNETPVANPDGSLNFSNIQIDSRSGTQAQSYMPGFADAVENEFDAPVELVYGAPWTQALTNLDLSAVRVRLSVPALQRSNPQNGDITGSTIRYIVELSVDGGAFSTVVTSGFSGKTTTKYERTHRIALPAAVSGWTIRITRQTAQANLAYVSDTTTVEGYTEIIDAKLRYPNSALIGILFDAKQFSNIPSRAYDLYGRIVKVPSNYNPDTRVYTGVWDGSFKLAWTDNPAWCFYDVATNKRFSVGRYVSEALMNKWALYDIAKYCDELVPDGKGGQEPRFTATVYLQTPGDAYRVLGDLASIFRGQMYWAAGAIQASADKPGDPDYPYNQSNVIGGKFTYSGSRRKTRYTVAMVTWNDPDDFGRQKVATVVDPDGLRRYGYQPTSLIAVGCRSLGQAQRAGYWTLFTSRLETETVNFKVGLDGTVVAPGRLVTVSDPARAGKRMGGRIARPGEGSATRTPLVTAAGDTVVALRDASGRNITSAAVVTELRRTDWRGILTLTTAARTNHAANSNDLSVWGGLSGSSTGAGVTAPDGVGTMTRITATTTGSTVARVQQDTGVATGQQYIASCYVRRDQNPYAKFNGFGNGANGVVFNLVTGVATIIDTWDAAGIEIIDANVARVWAVVTPISSGVWNVGLAPPAGGTFAGGEVLDFWGAQLADGNTLDALIVTGATAKTVTDYTVTGGKNVTLGEASDGVAAYDWTGTGAVGGSTTTVIQCDAAPGQVAVGDSLAITLSNAVTETRTISAIDGKQLTVSVAFSEVPVPDTVWQVESTTLQTAKYRVLSVREPASTSKDLAWEVTALLHNESKFAAVDIGAEIEIPPITSIPPSAQPAPQTVVLSTFQIKGAVATTLAVNIQWTPTIAAVAYRVEWRRDGGTWNVMPEQGALSADINSPKPGVYEARVYAINASRKRSLPTYADAITLADPTDLPTTVEEIQTQANNAKTDADNAIQQLAYIASDNELSQGEKPLAIRDYTVITSEQAGIDAEAARYSITTEKTAYDSAITALTTYLNGLNTPTAWNDLGGDTDIVGATWRSKWSAVYTSRQTLLNKILASAKANGDYAVNLGLAAPVVNATFRNGVDGWTFDTNGSGEWYTDAGSSSPDAAQSTYLVHKGVAGQTTTCAHNTGGGIPVKVGQTVTAMVALKSVGANAGSRAYVRIGWRNSAGALITNSTQGVTICTPDAGSTYFTQGVSRVYGTAPAGAVSACVEIEFDQHQSGFYTATSAWLAAGHASADEIPESDLRKWAIYDSGTQAGIYQPGQNAVWNPSFAISNSPSAGFPGWTLSGSGWATGSTGNFGGAQFPTFLENLCTTGTAYTAIAYSDYIPVSVNQNYSAQFSYSLDRSYASGDASADIEWMNSSTALISRTARFHITSDQTSGAVLAKLENLTPPAGAVKARFRIYVEGVSETAGGVYYRVSKVKFEVGSKCTPYLDDGTQYGNNLTVDGSGQKLGGLRNQLMVGVGNYGAAWNGGTVTYTATSTSATITASASTLILGSFSKGYNQASTTVSGSAGVTRLYYLYYDDDDYSGGSQTLHATTSQITSLNANGRLLVGTVSVAFPTSGTGGGSGGTGCPSVDAWVVRRMIDGRHEYARAGEVQVGDYLLLTSGAWGRVTYSNRVRQPGVRVVASGGHALTCSRSAPLELESGAGITAAHAKDHAVRVRHFGIDRLATIEQTKEVGLLWVQHITCENDYFWTGDHQEFLFAHHNLKPLPPG